MTRVANEMAKRVPDRKHIAKAARCEAPRLVIPTVIFCLWLAFVLLSHQ